LGDLRGLRLANRRRGRRRRGLDRGWRGRWGLQLGIGRGGRNGRRRRFRLGGRRGFGGWRTSFSFGRRGRLRFALGRRWRCGLSVARLRLCSFGQRLLRARRWLC
jgi:hypothetical protein